MRMERDNLEEKSSFKILGLFSSSKFDWGSYIVSIAKTAFKKIETLLSCMKFLSPEVAFYFFKSTTQPYIKHGVYVCAGAPRCLLGYFRQATETSM